MVIRSLSPNEEKNLYLNHYETTKRLGNRSTKNSASNDNLKIKLNLGNEAVSRSRQAVASQNSQLKVVIRQECISIQQTNEGIDTALSTETSPNTRKATNRVKSINSQGNQRCQTHAKSTAQLTKRIRSQSRANAQKDFIRSNEGAQTVKDNRSDFKPEIEFANGSQTQRFRVPSHLKAAWMDMKMSQRSSLKVKIFQEESQKVQHKQVQRAEYGLDTTIFSQDFVSPRETQNTPTEFQPYKPDTKVSRLSTNSALQILPN